jgi:hypothetical protein
MARASGKLGNPNALDSASDPRVSEEEHDAFRNMLARAAHRRQCHAFGHRLCKSSVCRVRCDDCTAEVKAQAVRNARHNDRVADALLRQAGHVVKQGMMQPLPDDAVSVRAVAECALSGETPAQMKLRAMLRPLVERAIREAVADVVRAALSR